jgi:hypothetical protein
MPDEMHVYVVHAHEMHAHEMHAYEIHASEMHAREVQTKYKCPRTGGRFVELRGGPYCGPHALHMAVTWLPAVARPP